MRYSKELSFLFKRAPTAGRLRPARAAVRLVRAVRAEATGIQIHFEIVVLFPLKRRGDIFLSPPNVLQLLLENQCERIIFTPARTIIRNRYLSLIDSNRQIKVCKESRQIRSVTLEKRLALKGREVLAIGLALRLCALG